MQTGALERVSHVPRVFDKCKAKGCPKLGFSHRTVYAWTILSERRLQAGGINRTHRSSHLRQRRKSDLCSARQAPPDSVVQQVGPRSRHHLVVLGCGLHNLHCYSCTPLPPQPSAGTWSYAANRRCRLAAGAHHAHAHVSLRLVQFPSLPYPSKAHCSNGLLREDTATALQTAIRS